MSAIDPVASLSGIQAAGTQAQVTSVQGSLSQGTNEIDPAKATVANIDELKTKYPDLYKAFMLMWASQLRAEQQRIADHALEEMKKSRQQ